MPKKKVYNSLPCFKAYDIRGKVPARLDCNIAWAVGRAAASIMNAKKAVIGWDARTSSPDLAAALVAGLNSREVDCHLLGLCGTEEIYFHTASGGFDLGIMITASHNPADENGLKLVGGNAAPIHQETGLDDIRSLARKILTSSGINGSSATIFSHTERDLFKSGYIDWLINYTGISRLNSDSPLKVAMDVGNGAAGHILEMLESHLPFEIVKKDFDPDGAFPHGAPNPLLPERRASMKDFIKISRADLGVSFDGDFDRCFFYDHNGELIESYYIIGILASRLLKNHPGAKIIHDPRVYWNTRAIVNNSGGVPVISRSGHSFIKQAMREQNALYGGEMSGHHFFRDFYYCDSGMLPMLLVIGDMLSTGKPLHEQIGESMHQYPCSGELNFDVTSPNKIITAVEKAYAPHCLHCDKIDGLNLEFAKWRMNLRASNTEDLLRLNIESRGEKNLVRDKADELSRFILSVI